MSDRERRGRHVATGSQTVGPFFHFGLTDHHAIGTIAGDGPRIRLRIQVLDGDGAPVPDAMIELYQADVDGVYGRAPFTGFGRLPTGEDGRCDFDTVRPGAASDGRGGTQAPHINVCVFSRGLLRHLYTRIYFAGDSGLDLDPLLSLVPAERKNTLLATQAGDGTWEFVIRLQGEKETVFFDI